jgi:hypothetical protein
LQQYKNKIVDDNEYFVNLKNNENILKEENSSAD